MSPSVIAIIALFVLAGVGLYFFDRRRSPSGVALAGDRMDDEDMATVDVKVTDLEAQKRRGEITDDEYRAKMAELVGDRRKFRWRRRQE